MENLKRCSRCVMAQTWSGITFDSRGVCNICRNYEKKRKVDWEGRQRTFNEILAQYRDRARGTGNKYDCMVGYSGGKDTAYTLWAMVKKYDMRPLAVTWDHGFHLSEDAEFNLMEVPKRLDVDHLRFTIGNGLRNEMCRKSSMVAGDFCYHCHLGVGAYPTRVSKMMDIPLQIWGEGTGEYQTSGSGYTFDQIEEQDFEHYKKLFQSGVTPEMVIPDGYESRDMQPFEWPMRYEVKALYLGSFEPWDQIEHAEIVKRELGWKPYPFEDFDPELIKTWGNYRNFDKVDCPYETVRNWQKYMRRGFDKIVFQASKDIREGLLTREQGLDLLKYEGQRPINMDAFCKETGITEEEFNRITKRDI